MNTKQCALLLIAGFSSTAHSAIYDVSTMSITGGDFSMAGAGGTIVPGGVTPMVMGTYQGSAPPTCALLDDLLPHSLAGFEFGFFGPAVVRTAETDGVNSGFAAPSAAVNTETGSINADLSSWTMYWCGTSYNLGSSSITGSYHVGSGNYDINWSATVNGGPFNGQVSDWHLTGVASVVVPVPAAVWLFGSGLIGLVGFARSRKQA